MNMDYMDYMDYMGYMDFMGYMDYMGYMDSTWIKIGPRQYGSYHNHS